jgi:four helix bundle protein
VSREWGTITRRIAMRKIEKFEDLVAWQKARVLTKAIYEVTRQGAFARDFGLSGQIQRAAVSIMSNIAEGVERTGVGELHHFLTIAKGSCGEVRSQLYVACDVGYLTDAQFNQLMALAEETNRVIGGLRASVDRARNY